MKTVYSKSVIAEKRELFSRSESDTCFKEHLLYTVYPIPYIVTNIFVLCSLSFNVLLVCIKYQKFYLQKVLTDRWRETEETHGGGSPSRSRDSG